MAKWMPAFVLLFNIIVLNAQTGKGIISGTVIDATTNQVLVGANILIEGTLKGAATNEDGIFVIQSVNAGYYSIVVRYIGYSSQKIANVIVRPGRNTSFTVKLLPEIIESDEIEVTAGYFSESEKQVTSAVNFSYEEIRRAPGSAGDVSRIMFSLPSIAKVNDQRNSLIVRGGSPSENAFLVDNIEIPNINHFPVQGTSGGPIGLINVDFIQDVNFYSGGFSPEYGDKLSSVMFINFREGSQQKYDAQLDMNMSGFGGVFEGPVGNNGNILLSVRRSYLDVLTDMFDTGSSVAPTYGDYQGKYTLSIDRNNKLSVIAIWSDDHANSDADNASENDMLYYGKQDILVGTTGFNWLSLWSKNGYSESSVSWTVSDYREDFYETGTNNLLIKNQSVESGINFRNTNTYRFNKYHTLNFGMELKYLSSDYNNVYGSTVDPLGNSVAEVKIKNDIYGNKIGVFANYKLYPVESLELNIGIRGDYFSFNRNYYLSPRFAAKYAIYPTLSIYGSVGVFTQSLPLVLLTQDDKFRKLDDPRALHYIIGIGKILGEATKLTLEAYYKDYFEMPVSPEQPGLFLTDEIFYNKAFYTNHANIKNNGKAKSYGVELMLQKKLAKDFYGTISGSYFRSKYTGYDGVERNRVFDNQYMFSIEGGYKPNNSWDFSFRWIYAGGVPYTPFNYSESKNANSGIMDKNKINSERYPDYHSLNIRADKRFNFSNSSLILYLSIWNVYNRENVASYYWNKEKNETDTEYQWGMLPIFGIEYEF